MSDQGGKVIELPIRPRVQESKNGVSLKSSNFELKQHRRKILTSVSIVSIVLGVTMVNKVLLDRPGSDSGSLRPSSPSRSIASLGEMDGSKNRDWTWERRMTNQLIESGSRAPASVGTKPSVEDQLQFGLLEGKYAVKIRNGKLENIRFVSLSEQPKYLVDRADFIEKYRGLIAHEFEEARLKDHTSSGRKTQETYALVAGNRSVAEVSFELDLQERLLNFAVHKSEQDQ